MHKRDELLNQISWKMKDIVARPSMWGGTPFESEIALMTLLEVALALESGISLRESAAAIEREKIVLFGNPLSVPGVRARLCETEIRPQRVGSFQLLTERGNALCERLLRAYREPNEA